MNEILFKSLGILAMGMILGFILSIYYIPKNKKLIEYRKLTSEMFLVINLTYKYLLSIELSDPKKFDILLELNNLRYDYLEMKDKEQLERRNK